MASGAAQRVAFNLALPCPQHKRARFNAKVASGLSAR